MEESKQIQSLILKRQSQFRITKGFVFLILSFYFIINNNKYIKDRLKEMEIKWDQSLVIRKNETLVSIFYFIF